MGTITLKEVLDTMDKGHSFSIAFVTADKYKKTGGEWIEIEKAWKYEPTAQRKKSAAKSQPKTAVKNPNHFDNSTRNLRLENGEIRKVHIRLIRRFNSLIVL